MGYHVSITREGRGSEAEIPLDEWLAYVRASPDLEFEYPANTGVNTESSCSNHTVRRRGVDTAWLEWSEGVVWTKNPSDEFIQYMIDLAPRLGARVRGDEGEFYRSPDDYYFEEDGREVSRAEYEQRERERVANPLYRVKSFLGKFGLTVLILLLFFLLRKLAT